MIVGYKIAGRGLKLRVHSLNEGMLNLHLAAAAATDQMVVSRAGHFVDQGAFISVGMPYEPILGQEIQCAVNGGLRDIGRLSRARCQTCAGVRLVGE
jgi:hypothetical protein